MNRSNLRILQLNVMKSRPVMEALINDEEIGGYDVLLIQEPPLSAYYTHVSHRSWHRYEPTFDEEGTRKRSLIYVNKRISTSAHRQVDCMHPDVTAIKVWTENNQMLLFSVYIPPVDYHHLYEVQSMQPTLDVIESTIGTQATDAASPRRTVLVIAGDFNRHHPAWSDGPVYERVMVHAGDLINFIHAHALQWCLGKGNATYWSYNRPGQRSTIDLTLTNEQQRLIQCKLHHDAFGSDHRATVSEWNMQVEQRPETPPKKAYDRADWPCMGTKIQAKLQHGGQIESRQQLDEAVAELTTLVQQEIDKCVPTARPSPYAKRWFTPELKVQQVEVNKARRRWQERCASHGRADPVAAQLFTEMHSQRREWTRTIEKAKASHWREFLDQASSRTVWKATPYLERTNNYACIPALKVGDNEYADNAGKAQALLASFFPTTVPPNPEMIVAPEEIAWEPITEWEVASALNRAKKNTAPGRDGLPTLVWRELWPYVSTRITQVFSASVRLAYFPTQWKTAKIVVLRKPGKDDYTTPKAYRPISLLNTLGKLLEAVMARRLSYYAETYQLLPDTQFGGRPGRTTEQALLVLVNSVDQTILRDMTVTLIAFDLKGAFNNVHAHTLEARLQERRIPGPARKWIRSFMQERTASVQFDGFETEVEPLPFAGLAQGSPLSPILFAFYNADLVDQVVDTQGGASAYIDDYFRWRVGKSAEENLDKIQNEDIPRITAWAERTGACFVPEKTELIHLTRRRKDRGKGSITIGGQTVKASETAKLLGVIFDTEMRWKEHVQHATKKATVTALGMSGLRYLRPAQMRQIYQACVLPKLDYASTVWHSPLRDKGLLRVLASVQRAALLRIISAFRTVATQTLEVECHILPTRLRLQQRAQDVIARLCTLPQDHPMTKVVERTKQRMKRKSGLRFPLAESMKTMSITELNGIEIIDPRPKAPWRGLPLEQVEIIQDRDQALARVEDLAHEPRKIIFTDASARDAQLGVGVVMLGPSPEQTKTLRVGVGPATKWNVHLAELMAIWYATKMIQDLETQIRLQGDIDATLTTTNEATEYTIVSDSQSALKAIIKSAAKSGQTIVQRVLDQVQSLNKWDVRVRLCWVPGHANNEGNKAADQLAKQAVSTTEDHDFRTPLSAYRKTVRQTIEKEWRDEWTASKNGKYLKKIDSGLPNKRALRLYGCLTRHETYLFTQLRSDHSWLFTYGKKRKFVDHDKCACGAVETVVHVLVDCPLLRELRQALRRKVGDAFGSIATLLGGRNGQGQVNNGRNDRDVVKAVLEFADASKRFKSRTSAVPSSGHSRL